MAISIVRYSPQVYDWEISDGNSGEAYLTTRRFVFTSLIFGIKHVRRTLIFSAHATV